VQTINIILIHIAYMIIIYCILAVYIYIQDLYSADAVLNLPVRVGAGSIPSPTPEDVSRTNLRFRKKNNIKTYTTDRCNIL